MNVFLLCLLDFFIFSFHSIISLSVIFHPFNIFFSPWIFIIWSCLFSICFVGAWSCCQIWGSISFIKEWSLQCIQPEIMHHAKSIWQKPVFVLKGSLLFRVYHGYEQPLHLHSRCYNMARTEAYHIAIHLFYYSTHLFSSNCNTIRLNWLYLSNGSTKIIAGPWRSKSVGVNDAIYLGCNIICIVLLGSNLISFWRTNE